MRGSQDLDHDVAAHPSFANKRDERYTDRDDGYFSTLGCVDYQAK
jgi:hypothetical protein